VVSVSLEVEVRLQLLALLEEWVRRGAGTWSNGPYIAAASRGLLHDVIIPNLIWRSGRVEATVRKVSLTVCFGILKAGATSLETLREMAPSLIPLLTSALDDPYSDVSPRHMSCICLSVVFERLRGSFGYQTLLEVYPVLLKRLDDSDDGVRIAICGTLTAFFLAAAPKEYR
jgi:dynein assembly factor 5